MLVTVEPVLVSIIIIGLHTIKIELLISRTYTTVLAALTHNKFQKIYCQLLSL